jgi:pimeloyl-ACP methyl ester carboxylesterase
VLRAAGDRFHLVGHSYGGAVALKAALAQPERVLSLTLFEPVLFSLLMAEDPDQPGTREIAAVRVDTEAAVERGDLAAAGERFVDYWMGRGAWASMPEKRRLGIASGMRKVKSEFPALVEDPTPLSAFAGLDVETLFLVGERSPASSRGVARLLTSVLPRVTVVEIAGVGHMGPITHPEKINTEIEAFLARSK